MLKRLEFKPGVNVEFTPTANRGGWSMSNCVRWRMGKPEAVLGWTALSTQALNGVCRALHYWSDLSATTRIAAGTNQRLYYEQAGAINDITPVGFVPGRVSSLPGIVETLLVWTLDNFGQNLVAVPSKQGLYTWVPGQSGPATLIPTAPSGIQGMFVSAAQQIIIAYGCVPLGGGTLDPMLVRWCDQSDDTDWTASTTNQAGSYRLPRGNRIISGMQMPNFALLWTDLDLWAVNYIGFPLVYSFVQVGSQCGLIGQHAATVMNGTAYWISDHGIFEFGGSGPQQIPCTVWDFLYKNLDQNNADKCVAGANQHYNEVWFFFPSRSGGSGEIDSYIKYNILEGEWDVGGVAADGSANAMSRTAWTDQNQPGDPVSVDLRSIMVQAEMGFTQAGLAAVPASITSGYQDIADGDDVLNVVQFIPDFYFDGPSPQLSVTIFYREWSGDTPMQMGPFTVFPGTRYITLQLPTQLQVGGLSITTYAAPRAREIAFNIQTVSGWWRLGTCRARMAPAGKL